MSLNDHKMTARGADDWPEGLRHLPAYLTPRRCAALLEEVVRAVRLAPFFTPRMPKTGRPFSVRMSNFGPLGWVSDKLGGYRYEPSHPLTGRPWPPMPRLLLDLWEELAPGAPPPQAGLINHYAPGAKMGLHVDADERAREVPILSISLGCAARFRIGGPRRRDPTRSFILRHGDVLLMAGEARHCYHGIDRILPGTGALPAPLGEGRINITLRRVT